MVDTDNTQPMTDDGRVWHKLPTGELTRHVYNIKSLFISCQALTTDSCGGGFAQPLFLAEFAMLECT